MSLTNLTLTFFRNLEGQDWEKARPAGCRARPQSQRYAASIQSPVEGDAARASSKKHICRLWPILQNRAGSRAQVSLINQLMRPEPPEKRPWTDTNISINLGFWAWAQRPDLPILLLRPEAIPITSFGLRETARGSSNMASSVALGAGLRAWSYGLLRTCCAVCSVSSICSDDGKADGQNGFECVASIDLTDLCN